MKVEKIGFLFLNKTYSIYHALGLAIELAKQEQFDVHIFTIKSNSYLIKELLSRFDAKNINVNILRPYWYIDIPHYFEIKFQLRPTLFYKYSEQLASFDTFVCTMYEDVFLKDVLGKKANVKFIFTNHGISNRAYSFDKRISQYDLFFILDKTELTKRKALQQVNKSNSVLTGLLKYDLIKDNDAIKLFDNDRPCILYNPHWDRRYSSFYKFGIDILTYFASQSKYNLIFAPHSLLIERNWLIWFKLQKFKKYNHIHIDLGSEASNDMSYTRISDFYLGDVSSQVFEFLYESQKPCLFLDPHNFKNSAEDRPLSWDLGPVINNLEDLDKEIIQAFDRHNEVYKIIQQNRLKEMFLFDEESPTTIAAKAVKNFISEKIV